ncbi:MAG: insulinase family protein [Chitinophagaceae bacterium]|nr:insulinase family protein [Chitinophagaceae bacterium]
MKKFFSTTKYRLLILLIITGSTTAIAQKGEPYELNINGVKIIVQPSDNQIVEIQTIVKGGVQNYGFDKQGIESLAMNALTECGTKKDDKNSFKNKLDNVSAQVYANAGRDYSTISMNCIKSDFNAVWTLYADAVTMPLFDEKEFNRIKQDAINGLRSQESQPDYAINNMATQIAFAGKNKAKRPEGTVETLSKLTVAETKAYYSSVSTKSRMLIVVVGELDKTDLEQKIAAMLAAVPEGKPFVLKKETIAPAQNSFKAEKKELATNYIQGIASAPAPGTPDFNAFNLAMRIFSQRHFLEVRTKNGLSYAPGSWFDGSSSPSAHISVSTTDPNKYIGVAKALIEKTKKEGFTADELRNMKTQYLTGFFYRQETNNAQANSLAANEVLHNNWKRALTLSDDMKKVTLPELNTVFNKYIAHMVWAYQGNPAQANPALFTGNPKPDLPKSKVTTKKKG